MAVFRESSRTFTKVNEMNRCGLSNKLTTDVSRKEVCTFSCPSRKIVSGVLWKSEGAVATARRTQS